MFGLFMESWILQVTLGFTYFARDWKYSWFHEHSKNLIYFLNKNFLFRIFDTVRFINKKK